MCICPCRCLQLLRVSVEKCLLSPAPGVHRGVSASDFAEGRWAGVHTGRNRPSGGPAARARPGTTDVVQRSASNDKIKLKLNIPRPF